MHVRNTEIPFYTEKSFFRKYSETHITAVIITVQQPI